MTGDQEQEPAETDWKYEPEENPKRKHHWKNDAPGFVEHEGVLIAKCPNNLTNADAKKILNSGVEWNDPDSLHGHPDRIYGVHQGTVYRATPTNPGKSYHGFPEMPKRMPPSRTLHEAIIELARIDGSEDEVRKWLKKRR